MHWLMTCWSDSITSKQKTEVKTVLTHVHESDSGSMNLNMNEELEMAILFPDVV